MQNKVRAAEMMDLSKLGFTLKEIGEKFGVSRERVRQILNQHYPNNDKRFRGASVRKQLAMTEEVEAKLSKAKEKWGIVPKGMRTLEQQAQFNYFRRLKQNARNRKIEFSIKMDDVVWPEVCPETGKPINWFSPVVSDTSPACRRLDLSVGYVPGNVQMMSWEGYRKYILLKHCEVNSI